MTFAWGSTIAFFVVVVVVVVESGSSINNHNKYVPGLMGDPTFGSLELVGGKVHDPFCRDTITNNCFMY